MSTSNMLLSFEVAIRCSKKWSTTALATTLTTFAALWPEIAYAGCDVSDLKATCSGGDIKNINSTGATYTDVTYSKVTTNFGPTDSQDAAYALKLTSTGSAGKSGVTDDSTYNGQPGGDGVTPRDLSTTMSFDLGYGIDSATGGIYLGATGGVGGEANEDKKSGRTAYGGIGGNGGDGAALTVTAKSDGGGKTPAAITTQNGAGLMLSTVGGTGGQGGKGDVPNFFHQGKGGVGGNGGDGGKITAEIDDGHSVNVTTSSSVGLGLLSIGGTGGEAGEGHSGDEGYGGDGGIGGDGGEITLSAASANNTIATTGDKHHGIVAISEAGDGGVGGEGYGPSKGAGGTGGTGGSGGDVDVDYSGTVATDGAQAQGIFIQSIGGAGGDGGKGDSTFDGKGGSTAGPGPAGNVTLTLDSVTTTTMGTESSAILLQSVGGFAGESGGADGFVAYGANGESGGNGAVVTANLDNVTLETTGSYSSGLVGISAGGGGGTGSKDAGFASMGAEGGAGGDGGHVSIALSGMTKIDTQGVDSAGIIALSVGGGGGVSGANDGVVAMGAKGGTGGDGGAVDLTNDGDTTITTKGDHSVGILMGSIGAGGGKSTSPGAAWAFGANGGDGGDGKDATLTLSSELLSINTSGENADGLLISSVGGGGGHGGGTVAAIDVFKPAVGSSGGSGGAGGDVTVTTDSGQIDIVTGGDKASGFVAHSIGGGGGDGGYVVNVSAGVTFNPTTGAQSTSSGLDGGTVSIGDKDTAGLDGKVATTGDSAVGVLLQSIGGGGGAAGNNVQVDVSLEIDNNLGSDGGSAGSGGAVLANTKVDVTTEGDHSDGIVAQSTGAGGGHSSNIVNASVGASMDGFSDSLGATGGSAGDGGSVTLAVDGSIQTGGGNSTAVMAQSIGGGGGKGGHTVDASVSFDDGSVELGADGGSGGNADDVDLTVEGDIITKGDLSYGIFAQSIAGGGGQAGTLISGNVSLGVSYTHGGNGGEGGEAGTVTVDNKANVETSGDLAIGILAHSLGGGGGAGGLTVSGTLSMIDVNITQGGDGGTGGSAGAVKLTNSGNIKTSGNTAIGILAQSHGGGGGAGGMLISASATAGEVSGAVDVSIGGSGGKGATADDVTVKNSGTVETTNYQSAGIVAQSTGGNGGTGGAVVSGIVSLDAEGSGTVNVAVGGEGGDGSSAGNVTVTNEQGADITTGGHFADAIFAHSVGGNGGVGGGSYAFSLSAGKASSIESTVTVGGSGGDGAIGGDITVNNKADLTTTGGKANGIVAHSVGGGGGTGGFGFLFAGEYSQKPTGGNVQVNIDTSVGGTGGKGANAGKVTVVNSGNISTQTETSYGIFAHSVGGGGGDGGSSGAHSLGYTKTQKKTDPKYSYGLTFNVGGSGGASGDGDDVSVSHTEGTITTEGNASYAIYAQSVGGGGGTAGNGTSDGKGWVADIEEVGEWAKDIYDTYEEISGLLKGSVSIGVNIGGSGGASGEGGKVTVENDGILHTTGDNGTAIYAQSVGGGGGNGGDGAQGLLTSLTVVGSGSGGGAAGDVSVTNTGTIKTEGDGAMGIYAQSVGGGGGSGGDMEGNLVNAFADILQTIGAEAFGTDDGGGGGAGGAVAILSSGDITTTGENAHGIWAQTVGGGGGAAGTLDTQALDGGYSNAIGSAGGDGDGGSLDLTVDGKIDVQGDGSHGVFMQSASGGNSYSGGIKLHVSGSISAAGDNSRAILAQTSETGTDDPKGDVTTKNGCPDVGTQCRGTTHIYVDQGGVVETTSKAAYETIAISGGRTTFHSDGSINYSNLVQNAGTIQSADADSVVIANDAVGGLRIHNLDGAVIAGSLKYDDANRTEFENRSGATFAGGSTLYLGKLGNYSGFSGGMMSAHGAGTIGTSVVSFGGAYSEAGTLHVDAAQGSDGTTSSDELQFKSLASSATVNLTGNIETVWTGSTKFASGDSGKLLIANFDDGKTLDSFSASATDTSTVSYTLTKDDSNQNVYVNYAVDYSGGASGASMGANARAYANYFNRAITTAQTGANNGKSESLSELATEFLNTASIDELETAYRHHAPDEYLIAASSAVSTALALNQFLNSCPNIDASAGIDFLHQNDCTWVMGIGERLHQKANSDSPEFDETSWGVAMGAQREVAGDTFIEIAGLVETADISGENFDHDGNRYALGVALKREIGRVTLSSTLASGIYSMSNDRHYVTGGNSYKAEGDVNGGFFGAELRASAVLLGDHGYYLKPSAALSYTKVWQDSFSESGAGPLNWNVGAVSEEWVAFTPSIEMGRAYSKNNRSMLTFVRAGVTATLNDPSMNLSSSLIGVDASAGEFNGILSTGRYQGELEAGFRMTLDDSLMVSLTGQTAVAEDRYDYGVRAKLEWRF